MSLRIPMILVATLALAAAQGSARADDGIGDFFRSIPQDLKRRNCWPKPFVCPDRQAVRQSFVGMIARGWELQNMIADQHFQEGTSDVTEAGRLKIGWILTEAPIQHRVIYVHRSLHAEEMAARMAAVRQVAGEFLRPGEVVPIVETSLPPPAWSADTVDLVTQKFRKVMPDPKLPGGASGSPGGGSGGGGSPGIGGPSSN